LILEENEECNKVFIVNEGIIKLTKNLRNKTKVLTFLGKGNIFGIQTLEEGKSKIQYSAYALEKCKLLIFDSVEYDNILKENTEIARENSIQWFDNFENNILRFSHLIMNDSYIEHVSCLYLLRLVKDKQHTPYNDLHLTFDDLKEIFGSIEELDKNYLGQLENMNVLKRSGEKYLLTERDKMEKCLSILMIKKKSQDKSAKKGTFR
jgi:CRP-like cAMP-binding protein